MKRPSETDLVFHRLPVIVKIDDRSRALGGLELEGVDHHPILREKNTCLGLGRDDDGLQVVRREKPSARKKPQCENQSQ